MKPAPVTLAIIVAATCWVGAQVYPQLVSNVQTVEHPAITYRDTQPKDPAGQLDARLEAGARHLPFESRAGYLKSLLAALDIPIESQIAVYSRTSLQAALVSPANPRVIYFNDSTAVAWMPGGFIEVASQDPRQGAMFYGLEQDSTRAPRLVRQDRCLTCHIAAATEGVPGFFLRSIPTAKDGSTLPWLGNATTDHRSAFDERWGGWYVTGHDELGGHLGNTLIADPRARELPPAGARQQLQSFPPQVDASAYLGRSSDVVALLVFNHQAHAMNLLTRIGWNARVALHSTGQSSPALRAEAAELVDYLLFIDEAPLRKVAGTSGFAERFEARGVRDKKGRSLRDLDLGERLMRYPLSYMIYADAFDGLPSDAKAGVYSRLWEVLAGLDPSPRYARLSPADRSAIVEILRDTKPGLPRVFLTEHAAP